jgi:thiol:disulfide interchange protein DsbA
VVCYSQRFFYMTDYKQTRRELAKFLAVTPALLTLQSANSQPTSSSEKPKEPMRPFRSVSAPEDSRRVLIFIDFACPFCARMFEPLQDWSVSVPKQVQVLIVPVVVIADQTRKNEQIIAAQCYYSAAAVATKAQMAIFAMSVFNGYPNAGSLTNKDLWKKALNDSGIEKKKFLAQMGSKNIQMLTQYAARKTSQYRLVATPSIGVGGKYVLTPDDVNGDDVMFFNILNGLTSEIL